MKGKGRVINIALILLIVLSFISPSAVCFEDRYISGDEVVSLSMSNNCGGGFVFSAGRVSSYFENEIFGDSIGETATNLVAFVTDILQNRTQAEFFSYGRDPETSLYTNAEVNDWFAKSTDERFNVGRTWLSSLSDDANSFLYYCLLNVFSSIFLGLSATKWPGFILNYLCLILGGFVLYNICRKLKNSKRTSIGLCSLWALSNIALISTTYIRTYNLATVFSLLLVLLHLIIYDAIQDKDIHRIKKYSWLIIPVYAFGYVSHYTVGVVLASLALVTFIYLIKRRYEVHASTILQYVLIDVISVGVGICIDPTSVLGLLSKLTSATSSGTSFGEKILSATDYVVYDILQGWIFCAVFILIIVVGSYFWIRTNSKLNIKKQYTYLAGFTFVFYLAIIIGTGRIDYGRAVWPILFLLLAKTIVYCIRVIFTKDNFRTFAITGVCCLYIVCSIFSTYKTISSENTEADAKTSALTYYDDSLCIYFRTRSAGYQDTVYLTEFDSVQVITISTDSWWEYVDSSIFEKENIVLYFTDNTLNDEIIDWLEENSVSLGNVIYEDEYTGIYEASADVAGR